MEELKEILNGARDSENTMLVQQALEVAMAIYIYRGCLL